MPMLTIEDIINKAIEYKPDFDHRKLKQAYEFAKEAYDGMYKLSGDSYLFHVLAVTDILMQLKPYEDTLIAALLHELPKTSNYDSDKVEKSFGINVRLFIEGIAKIRNLRLRQTQTSPEVLRKLIMSIAKYLRVILIRLADVQHNMETLDFVQPSKRKNIAKETLDVYVPIAARLGIYSMKTCLEDLAFRYLYPDQYVSLKYELDEYVKRQEKIMENVKADLENFLASKNIEGRIEGRLKGLYSIYTKLKRKSRTMLRDINDIFAFRLILPTHFNQSNEEASEHLYVLLGLIHSNWTPLLNRFKDYIAVPKPNGYRSLHTTIIDFVPKPLAQPIELQIRSEKMHKEAEFGVASHWLYHEDRRGSLSHPGKEKAGLALAVSDKMKMDITQTSKGKEKKYQNWFSGLSRLRGDISGFRDARFPIEIGLFEDRIFVFTPKGDVKDLPSGSTPVDLAYAIHTDIGHSCHGAKVNDAIIPLDYKLKSGEIVEILVKSKKDPKLHWLSFVKTSLARNKIKSHFKGLDKESSMREGIEAVNKLLKNMNLPLLDDTFSILKHYGDQKLSLRERSLLLEEIGNGSISVNTVMKKIFGHVTFFKRIASNLQKTDDRQKAGAAKNSKTKKVVIGGASDIAYKFSSCCHPEPENLIIGYVSRGNAVRIHLQNCRLLKNADQKRTLHASWGEEGIERKTYPVKIHLKANDRVGLIRDIADVFADLNVNIVNFSTNFKKEQSGIIDREMIVEVLNEEQVKTIVKKLGQVYNVLQVGKV